MKITGGRVLCLIHRPTGQRHAILFEDNGTGVCGNYGGENEALDHQMNNIYNMYGKIKLKEFSLVIVDPKDGK